MSLFIALAIMYTIVLLIWTAVNNHGGKSLAQERRWYEEEQRERKDEYRKITAIKVIFKDGPSTIFDEAKTYYTGGDYIEIFNEEDKSIAYLDKREVVAMSIEREGDK